MSWQASQWAANIPHGIVTSRDGRAQTVGYVAFRALTLLANDAKEDGRATWLEASTVAERLGVSLRTAERGFKELRDADLIEYGDQRYVAHLPKNRRPPVYNLTMRSHDELTAAPSEMSAQDSAPSEMSAQDSAPSDLSGPTSAVVSSKEEPPLKPLTTTTQRNHKRATAQPVDKCPRWRDMPHTLVAGRCVDCGYIEGSRQREDAVHAASEMVAS